MSGARPKQLKVVLLGEGRVGKTSILLRYTKGEYDDRQVSTLQASYLDKRVPVGSETALLSIWDTAGQERFHALGPIYYRDADGALLVYDITDNESFNKVKTWVRELRRIVGSDIAITIAGNKVDLEKNRQVDEAAALEYARSVNAAHVHTSAKLNRGLDDAFTDLAERILQQKARAAEDTLGVGPAGGRGGVRRPKKQGLTIVDDEPRQQSRDSSCC
mmetsp:Transcript_18458/g.36942  ORF Transcript_18458/g.36942 Transcript_18458/m.36942 type:complete len:218 (-) Transcript_18458:7-660(-)